MSETIELPKPKRVYKKKATSTQIVEPPIVEPVATPIPELIAIPDPPVLTRETNEPLLPLVGGGLNPQTPIKEKKPRSQKQIEAFNRMREAKQKKKQELKPIEHEPIVEPEPEPEPIITQLNNTTNGGLGVSPNKPKKTYKKKEPQQVYIDARTINTANPETYNDPPIYTQQNGVPPPYEGLKGQSPYVPQRIQEKTYKPYIFV